MYRSVYGTVITTNNQSKDHRWATWVEELRSHRDSSESLDNFLTDVFHSLFRIQTLEIVTEFCWVPARVKEEIAGLNLKVRRFHLDKMKKKFLGKTNSHVYTGCNIKQKHVPEKWGWNKGNRRGAEKNKMLRYRRADRVVELVGQIQKF